MNRRGFLEAILAGGVAPAIAGSVILMPIKKIIAPSYGVLDIPHPGNLDLGEFGRQLKRNMFLTITNTFNYELVRVATINFDSYSPAITVERGKLC